MCALWQSSYVACYKFHISCGVNISFIQYVARVYLGLGGLIKLIKLFVAMVYLGLGGLIKLLPMMIG